ncbi:hypothetical protein HN873_042175 [Arachis hypogaea]
MYICAHINRKNNLRCSLPPFANLTVVAPYGFASFFRRTLPGILFLSLFLFHLLFLSTTWFLLLCFPFAFRNRV